MSKGAIKESGEKLIVQNKRARFDFHIIETFEAGIVLTGSEIKSIRLGEVSIAESYIRPEQGEIFLLAAHIKPYAFNSNKDDEAARKRKLLMHKHEIEKLRGNVEQKGLTIIPLRMYFKRGRAKLEIALAKGKDAPDKRQTTKDRESQREIARAVRGKPKTRTK
jgi:SsrA-binding protein